MPAQAQLNIDMRIIQSTVADRAAGVLPSAAALRGADGHAWAAAMATDCLSSLPACPATDLNPFPRGVNVTMSYGRYIAVEPEALSSYYTNNFLQDMVDCTEDDSNCDSSTPPEEQVRRHSPRCASRALAERPCTCGVLCTAHSVQLQATRWGLIRPEVHAVCLRRGTSRPAAGQRGPPT